MSGVVRTVLIDPEASSRRDLQRTLGAIPSLQVAEVLEAFQGAARRVAEAKPDLVVVSIDSDARTAIGLIQELVKAHPEAAILPASRVRDSSIILGVFRAGAREFATLGMGGDELARTIERLVKTRTESKVQAPRGPRIIAVGGSLGGVGSTTIAVNLATCLATGLPAKDEHAVALADFDLLLGSVDACLDIVADQTLLDVALNVDRLDVTLLRRATARHACGLHVLPRPAQIEDVERIDPDALRRVLNLMKTTFASVVIDTSKGFQQADAVAYEMADMILLVVQLDPIGLRNTARLLQLFQQAEGMEEKIRLVANRVGSLEGEISPKKAEEVLRTPISWTVPNATRVVQAARLKGQPLASESAGCRAHQTILEIAHALRPFPVEEPIKPRKGLFAALF